MMGFVEDLGVLVEEGSCFGVSRGIESTASNGVIVLCGLAV